MATTDIRTPGAFSYASLSYDTTAKQPLDARMLVPSVVALTLPDNWKTTLPNETVGTLAYNGMIVAVADKDSATDSGIYMLMDYLAKKNPDTSNIANWHKLCKLSELNSLADRVATLEEKNPEINYEELIAQLKAELVSIETYNTDKEETDSAIAALQTSTQNNTDAIAALVGTDTDKSVRDIIDAAVSETSVDDQSYNGITALATQVLNNSSAIAALTGFTEERVEEIAIQAVETKVQETNSAYNDIAALVNAVTVAKSHADNAEVKLNALLSDKYYNEPIYLGEIIGNEIAAAGNSFDADNTINSIAALTQTTIKNKNDLAALINDLDGAVIDGFESLVSDRAEFYIETVTVNDPDGSTHTEKRLRINQIELSKIIHTDNTTIVIHGGCAST